MEALLAWFTAPLSTDPLIKAALPHLWFVTIHPFEDGNGRIARAIGDLALARSERNLQRFYNMSTQIQTERNAYCDQLERTQKGSTDVTAWTLWFLGCLGRAIHAAEGVLAAAITKPPFRERAGALALNEPPILVLSRLLDGFEGKMTPSKWTVIAKCSQDTANRDIAALIDLGLLWSMIRPRTLGRTLVAIGRKIPWQVIWIAAASPSRTMSGSGRLKAFVGTSRPMKCSCSRMRFAISSILTSVPNDRKALMRVGRISGRDVRASATAHTLSGVNTSKGRVTRCAPPSRPVPLALTSVATVSRAKRSIG